VQAGPRFLGEAKLLLKTLGVQEAPWLNRASDLFRTELRATSQFQVRLDASFVGLVVRSQGGDIRSHMYALLADRHLDFQVASRCEDLAKRFPDAPWMAKVSLGGAELHAKLFMDQPLSVRDTTDALSLLEVPPDVGGSVADTLVQTLGITQVRRLSASPGEPVRAEIYGGRDQMPGGGENPLPGLLQMTGLEGDPSAAELLRVHDEGARHSRQRYVVGLDGRGMRKGLKVEYTHPTDAVMNELIEAFVPAPIFGQRRLKNTMGALGGQSVDHVSVRLRPGRPPHLTVYFDRSFLSVA